MQLTRLDNSSELNIDGAILDPVYQTLSTNDKIVRLREKLFQVLYFLVQNKNHLVLREHLIEHCWNGNYYTGNRAITHTICHLRKLLKQLNLKVSICTLPKQGYILTIGPISKPNFNHSDTDTLERLSS